MSDCLLYVEKVEYQLGFDKVIISGVMSITHMLTKRLQAGPD